MTYFYLIFRHFREVVKRNKSNKSENRHVFTSIYWLLENVIVCSKLGKWLIYLISKTINKHLIVQKANITLDLINGYINFPKTIASDVTNSWKSLFNWRVRKKALQNILPQWRWWKKYLTSNFWHSLAHPYINLESKIV